jgi:hypothetical protein
MYECVFVGCCKKLKLSSDGSDSGSKKWKRGYCGACSGAWQGSMESGRQFCVCTVGRNLVSIAVESHLYCTLWRYGPWRTLTSLKTDFHSSLLRAFPLQPLILILLRSSSTSSSHRIMGLPTLASSFRFAHIQFFDDLLFWHPFYMTQPSQSCFINLCDCV